MVHLFKLFFHTNLCLWVGLTLSYSVFQPCSSFALGAENNVNNPTPSQPWNLLDESQFRTPFRGPANATIESTPETMPAEPSAPTLHRPDEKPDEQPEAPSAVHEFWATRDYEAGVTDHLLLEYFGRFELSPLFAVLLGADLSFFDQWGANLIGATGFLKLAPIRSEIALGLQQEEWPSWKTTENRLVLYWYFAPIPFINVSFGYSYRAPLYAASSFIQTLSWPSVDAEYGVLYRFEMRILDGSHLKASILMWNYDRMRLYTWDNFHFTFQPEYQLDSKFKIQARIGTAAKGISGGVVSWDQEILSLGITYAP